MSFNHLRNQIQTSFNLWRNSLELFAQIGLCDLIWPEALVQITGMRHGLNSVRIDRLHAGNQFENFIDLVMPDFCLAGCNGNAGQTGDPLNILQG